MKTLEGGCQIFEIVDFDRKNDTNIENFCYSDTFQHKIDTTKTSEILDKNHFSEIIPNY